MEAQRTSLAHVPMRGLLGELERRAQHHPDAWSTEQVLHVIVIAVVLGVLVDVGDQHGSSGQTRH